MTPGENISDFNACSAVVLSTLYDSFPVPITVSAWSLESKDDQNRSLKVFDDHPGAGTLDPAVTSKLETYRWSIQFLIHEGFVRNLHEERIDQALRHGFKVAPSAPASPTFQSLVLTAKGLTLLNAVPKAIQGKPKSHIERLKDALVEHSEYGLKEAIGALIAQGVAGVFG